MQQTLKALKVQLENLQLAFNEATEMKKPYAELKRIYDHIKDIQELIQERNEADDEQNPR
jgi:hypothetical protein